MRLNSIEYAKYRVKCYNIYQSRANGRCECCGMTVHNPDKWNFAHIQSGNGRSKKDGMQNFLFVCRELHTHQHNCKAHIEHPCVKLFREKYFTTEKHRFYYDKMIADKGIKFE